MKSEKLMEHIGEIEERIIVEADAAWNKRRPIKHLWVKWVAVAAAIVCLIIATPFVLLHMMPTYTIGPTGPIGSPVPTDPAVSSSPDRPTASASPTDPAVPIDPADLPKLTVNDIFGAMGYEGYMAYDISELQNSNPWTAENDLTTMPVFTNPDTYNSWGMYVNGLSPEEMLANAEDIANAFNLEITDLYTAPTLTQIEQIKNKLRASGASEEEIEQNEYIERAVAECPGVKIQVRPSGEIQIILTPETADLAKELEKLRGYDNFDIHFEYENEVIDGMEHGTGLPLPSGYAFKYYDIPHEQALEITQYLFSEYGAFMGITTPGYDVAADYTYDGDFSRISTYVFENAGSLTDRILNYHFDKLSFSATNLGGLGGIHYNKTDLSQKIGDYPIITAEEAKGILLEGEYLTTVHWEFPGEENIAHVELVYRTSEWDKVFMPYYRFLIEIPEIQHENGLKTFGAYYVPAVESEFLEYMPVWDGGFNK